jgi:Tol biopolymer transport system component
MGEVYRARDTTLQRFVALKVLSESVARDPERIARLQREARTLAALNDPNIAAIYGFQEAGGRHALVLELVEGPTVADRIARGPLPISDAFAIAKQTAKALEAAHRQGIVHRDLKPANIKVREDGTVKVLDFGLAKALDSAPAAGGLSSPTITSPAVMTAAGVILGSAAYMAPEQAKGLAADTRSDIWAFGCVLYEMLTGRRAFDGTSVTETLAAILRGEPDWSALPPDLPPIVRTLTMRCLEKDRGDRVQDISTARFVLVEQASFTASPAHAAPSRRSTRSWWIAVAALVGVAAVVSAAAWAWLAMSGSHTLPQTARFQLAPGVTRLAVENSAVAASQFGSLAALSPDGSRIVYAGVREGVPQLMTRPLDRLDVSPILGAEGGLDPFFSPDGRQVGFVTAGQLKRIPIEGGQSVTIWRGNPTFEGAAWAADGTIIYSQDGQLFRIATDGGQPVRLAQPDAARGEVGYDRPVILPSGKFLLYTVELSGGRSRVDACRIDGGGAKTILENGLGAQYLPPGYLVFARTNHLLAVAFNAETLHVSGTPVTLEEGVFTNTAEGVSNVSVAADGTAVFVAGHNSGLEGRPVWVDRTGAHVKRLVEQPLTDPRNVRLSPDGRRVALTIGPPGQADIWVYDLERSAQPVQLTFRNHNTFPVWSPNGQQIAFMNVAGAVVRDFTVPSDGSGVEPQPITTDAGGAPLDWSPRESALLLYWNMALSVLRPPDRTMTVWAPVPFPRFGGRFSHDGRWVAYASTQTGSAEIWVRPFPGPGAPVRVSAGGGHSPVWSSDDKEIFFTNGPKMMAASVTALDPAPVIEPPRQLFEGGFHFDDIDLILRYYDVAADGRFLMIEPVQSREASIVVALHWDEELKKRIGR